MSKLSRATQNVLNAVKDELEFQQTVIDSQSDVIRNQLKELQELRAENKMFRAAAVKTSTGWDFSRDCLKIKLSIASNILYSARDPEAVASDICRDLYNQMLAELRPQMTGRFYTFPSMKAW